MKPIRLLLLTFLAMLTGNTLRASDPPSAESLVPQRAMKVNYTLLVPTDKTSERVKMGERNPFGKSDDSNLNMMKGTNEENIIRDHLVKLRASGASFEADNTRVMLGDMILRPDEFVPPVMQHQTLLLRVSKIRRDSIELQWVEKKYTGLPPRILTIPMDLRATVRYQLQGQPSIASLSDKKLSKVKMGEQVRSEFTVGPASTPESNSVPNSKIGGAWEADDNATKTAAISSDPPVPAAASNPAAGANALPALAPVNLNIPTLYIPKKPATGKSPGTDAK